MSYTEIAPKPYVSAHATDSPDPNGFKLIPNRIFVGGMSRDTTEEDLLRYFAAYGNVKSAKIITDINTGASKGYGFVTFASEEEALRLQKFGGIAILHNRKLNIGPAIKRNVSAVINGPANQSESTSTPNLPVAVPKPVISDTIPEITNPLSLGLPYNGLFPGLSLDPSLLYQPFYGLPLSYLYPGSPAFQFPY